MVETMTSNGKTASESSSKPKRKRERKLPTLIATGQQERKMLKLTGSVSANAQEVANNKFPLLTPFVTSPESSELFVKLSKHEVVSLLSQQRFSTAGVVGYLVNLA
ncbi:hypothetical protein [Nostoc sp. MS1]|uniref:hypothetical protein n=1 Tax=Nostoc sp. MS1 TaxID=2764711 RepID=UPI001CC7FFF8|nr:hypothetical protein [Nostoc sp. MS1]BCL34588.1 hypothetical protein NSMS1_10350 [Nostoc sp. MS1]